MSCLDEDTVLGLVEGRLAPLVLEGIDAHLDDCVSCRDVVSQVARVQGRVLERGHMVGRYILGDLLGEGAMGRVYSAWEPELDRRVALKLLVSDRADAHVREAQAMAKLDHPNVVGVHEVGTSADGVYVAMNLVDGETLRVWAQTPRTWKEALHVLVEVARGLSAVHAAGVVHRDIKPDNIIVGTDGRTRLGDFGLARSGTSPRGVPTDDALALGTPVTAVAGTPAYMAPEVLRGEPATSASDQYSFGIMAYEVLSGTRPFSAESWSTLIAAIEAKRPAPLRDVPAWLDAAVQRCLAVDPSRRFGSLADVATHLSVERRSPVRWIAGVGAAALVASAVTFALVDTPPTSCDLGSAALSTVWNPTIRAQHAAIGTSALGAIDRWSARWISERDAVCQLARTEAAPVVAARTRCLEQRRSELAALLEQARGSDRVIDALATLPLPAECSTATLGTADPRPLDPTRAAQVAEVERTLPSLRATISLGDPRPVLARVDHLVATATASGHAPTLAEALLVATDARRGASQLAAAVASARDAVAAAERGHADLVGARAWIARVAMAGEQRDLTSADDLATIAAAAIDRAGAPPSLIATLTRLRGLVAYNRGDLDAARTLLTDARTRTISAFGADAVELSTVESALGSVARAAHQLDEAERWHRRALDRDRILRGTTHPDLARDLHNLAGVQRLRGNLDEAAATYRAALEMEIAMRGASSIEAGLTHNSLGLVEMARKDWSAALAELTSAYDALSAAEHGDRAFALHNLGLTRAARGEHAAALAYYQRAAAIYATTIGDRADAALRLRTDRAASELALRQRSVNPATIVTIEPPPRVVTVTPPAAAVMAPVPPPPAPKPDVGVYGSTQSW